MGPLPKTLALRADSSKHTSIFFGRGLGVVCGAAAPLPRPSPVGLDAGDSVIPSETAAAALASGRPHHARFAFEALQGLIKEEAAEAATCCRAGRNADRFGWLCGLAGDVADVVSSARVARARRDDATQG